MKVVWSTGTRAGSEFAIKLTRKALGTAPDEPYCAITPARIDSYAKAQARMFNKGMSIDEWFNYFETHAIKYSKIEHPGKDFLAVALSDRYPECKFITTVRNIEHILESHGRISWGHNPQLVVHNWMTDLNVLEWLKQSGRLYAIDVDAPDKFDVSKFCRFLGVQDNSDLRRFVDSWPAVNTAEYQIEKHGEKCTSTVIDNIGICRGFLAHLQCRYKALV